MESKYNLILSAEASFARRVALADIVTRPVKPWLQLIPGMFIFDFLKRTTEIRRYSQYFMFPRKIAMDLSQEIVSGKERDNSLLLAKEKLKKWLGSLRLYSPAIHQAHTSILNLLIDHYSKLLNADGDTFNYLVKDAYNHQENYAAFLSRLASVEKEVDRAITETLGENEKLREKILAEQRQLEKQREKNLAEIF